ncbi:MAG: electron transfer flavoprotein subunit alpha/FixB family protein [Oscillospiraceae bacterium]
MNKIVVFSEKPDIAANLLTFARGLSEDVEAITIGEAAGAELSAYGAKKILLLSENKRPESYGEALAAWLVSHGTALFLVGSTALGRELAASVAGYADGIMVSEAANIVADKDGFTASVTIHGGLISREEHFSSFAVVTLAKGIAVAEKTTGLSETEVLELMADTRVTRVSQDPIPKAGVDLTAAKRIVSIGMGCDEPDVETARSLAALIDGELACSRSLAEQRHWLPLDRYVGISGVITSPDLYLTLGISGQIQHVFGARDSKIIAAINKDENAPIFAAADYGIVGDIHTFMPLLAEALQKAKK